MASAPVPRDRGDFHIVILCALEQEAECVHDAFDKTWDSKKYGKTSSDDNVYTLGAIGEHNIVLVHMPGMGTDRATAAVTNLRSSFRHVKLALVVGVCGGMPYTPTGEEIVLGDVVISEALVRYDFGRQYPQGFKRRSEINDVLGPPTENILSLLKKLKTKQARVTLQDRTVMFLGAIQQKSPELVYPGAISDVLYHSSYAHQHHAPQRCSVCEKGDEVCEDAITIKCEDLRCDTNMRVSRLRLTTSTASSTPLRIHFGIMASGNTVMKSGHHRDALAEEGVIAVEMEGAGVWKYGPTVVIKGVCDYADSHKRKTWQRYAAATAAACTKAFLLEWTSEKRQDNPGQPLHFDQRIARAHEVFDQSTNLVVDKMSFNAHFEVPEHRVETLFGREEELTKIATFFQRSDEDSNRPRTLVLHAMGGQGKSQIALEHCHRTHARQTHHAILWVNGSSNLTTTQSLVTVAQQICGPAAEALRDDEAKVQCAIRTLERWDYRWLIVFDNCDDATTFSTLRKKFLPKVGNGDLLFTSRHQGLGELGKLMEISALPPEAGVELLLRRYRTDINYEECMTECLKIVERLGGLALAIDQASAYMQYRLLPLDQLHTFLPLFLAERANVLKYTKSELWNYMKIQGEDEQETVVGAFTTWEMSFQQLLHNHEHRDEVEHLFTLSAFFGSMFVDETLFELHLEGEEIPPLWMRPFCMASEAIPHTSAAVQSLQVDSDASRPVRVKHTSGLVRLYKRLRSRTKKRSHPTILPASASSNQSQAIESEGTNASCESWNPNYFWNLIHQAFEMSLLQDISPAIRSAKASFLFHPLVRDWLQVRLALAERQAYTREAIQIISSSIRTYTSRNIDAQMRTVILTHMDAALMCDAEFFSDNYRLGHDISSCNDAGWFAIFYNDQGQYDASLRLLDLQKTTYIREFGPEHPDTLTSMNNLALVLWDQGKYKEAEQIYRRMVKTWERVLGPEHLNTLTSINNLALVLCDQGKYEEAEQLHRRELKVVERVLGPEHPSTLTSMNNLAVVLCDQGKYEEAEQMHRRGLKVEERVLGPEHPDTLTSINNLAVVLCDQGKYEEAEQLHRRELKVVERVLGPEHPSTLTSMNNLAIVLRDQGKYEKAEQIHRRELKVVERVLGLEHPNTLTSMNNLAVVLRKQGKYEEAEQIHRQVMETREQVLGLEHPNTLTSMDNLAATLNYQGRHDEAETIQIQAFRSSLVTLGSQHPITEGIRRNLLYTWEQQGRKTPEIESMLQNIIEEASSSSVTR